MLNKNARAKLAKDTINDFIPKILSSNPRAKDAINKSELIHYSPDKYKESVSASKDASTPPTREAEKSELTPAASTEGPKTIQISSPKIRVIQSDTFDAAQALHSSNSKSRVGVLNMASALQPGGGVLNGALAQEEALCTRSTLYPSLRENFYRIPETAAIYSPDILVFRSSSLSDLRKADWFFVDVISCAALKGPDVAKNAEGQKVYEMESDREVMTMKVRLILQVAREKSVRRLVLGALGCGAYRNPPEEVAKIFRKVILGDKRRKGVNGFEEIVFAIFDDGENLRAFREVFADVLEE
jgi:uncharacterized protein (TIGR02452 family)